MRAHGGTCETCSLVSTSHLRPPQTQWADPTSHQQRSGPSLPTCPHFTKHLEEGMTPVLHSCRKGAQNVSRLISQGQHHYDTTAQGIRTEARAGPWQTLGPHPEGWPCTSPVTSGVSDRIQRTPPRTLSV